jgi:hypothetical protein
MGEGCRGEKKQWQGRRLFSAMVLSMFPARFIERADSIQRMEDAGRENE